MSAMGFFYPSSSSICHIMVLYPSATFAILEMQHSPFLVCNIRHFYCASNIFRTYVLMQHLDVPISQWINKLSNNLVLRTICGFLKSELPSVASFYSFVERIVGSETKPKLRRFKRKPKHKLKQGEKLKPKHPNITQELKKKILKVHRFNDPVADILNAILSLVVNQSINIGLVETTINISVQMITQ